MHKKVSRRQLLKGLAAAAGGMGLSAALGRTLLSGSEGEPDQVLEAAQSHKAPMDLPTTVTVVPLQEDGLVYVPHVYGNPTATPTPTGTPTTSPLPIGSRVVHVHASDATSWDFGDDYYGNYVDQDAVNAVVDRGVIALTGTASVAQAWQTLVPGYAPGKAVAIKVNLNNSFSCDAPGIAIDALIHPINSLIRGLVQAYPSFQNSDVWVYEASTIRPSGERHIPQRFKDGCLYPGVRFFDRGCSEAAGYTSTDPSAVVAWRNPAGIATPPSVKVTDVLVDASYVINVPIIKAHCAAGVTLSFKNHLGSIAAPADLHDWVYGPHFGGPAYSPLVDLYRNSHIANKTILTIGEGLFGNWEDNRTVPLTWSTFGGRAANSLFFAIDPVAADCVMYDLLDAERRSAGYSLENTADDYLEYAASVGLGTYEHGDPWGRGYSEIDYVKLEL